MAKSRKSSGQTRTKLIEYLVFVENGKITKLTENHIFVDDKIIIEVTNHGKDCQGDHNDNYVDHNRPNATVEEITFTRPTSINR